MTELLAFVAMEPQGERRSDMRAALIAYVMASVNRSSKEEPLELADFLLDFKPRRELTEEEQRQANDAAVHQALWKDEEG